MDEGRVMEPLDSEIALREDITMMREQISRMRQSLGRLEDEVRARERQFMQLRAGQWVDDGE
jgi:hypothetical protein